MKKSLASRVLGRAALIAALAGAAGSVGLTLFTGRHNNSLILMALFALWVLSPFVAALWASAVSKRWPVPGRSALHIVTLVLTAGSLAIYGVVALGPPRAQTAFAFLVVPLVSSALIAVAVSIAAIQSRKR